MLDTAGFTGTENWYQHWANKHITYTDGVKYVADTAGAYWLIDEIVFNQSNKKIQKQDFQTWKLVVDIPNRRGTLTCEDGDYHVLFTKTIAFTDFPDPEIKFFFVDNVILLPSEY